MARKAILSKAQVELLSREDGKLTIEFECPDLQVERDSVTGRITGLNIAGAMPCFEKGVPRLPVMTQFLDCLPGRVSVQIVDIESDDRLLGAMTAMPDDIPVDSRPSGDEDSRGGRESLDDTGPALSFAELCAMTPLKQGFWPREIVTIQDAGVFRGHRLMTLHFHPVQVDAARGLAKVIRRVRVQVTMPHSETATERIPDRPAETDLVKSLLGPLRETALPARTREAFTGDRGGRNALDEVIGERWKLIVREECIVRVTGAQLRAAGCPIDLISTLDTHIKNRGQEIPIYFAGETDGRFDDYDYIEFRGEPNNRTFTSYSPALYQDPWTENNVYWLSWGDGRTGLRLSEEDGAYHPDWPSQNVNYVRAVQHFEKDQRFDRLSARAEEMNGAIQTGGPLGFWDDHWFWGERIDAMSTRDYSCFTPFPYVQSPRGVVVRAALQGITTRTMTTSGDHRAIVRINGLTAKGLSIGKISVSDQNTAWLGQAAVIIQNTLPDTGSPDILTEDLVAGNNVVSVFLPGDGLAGRIDKIFANWFEIEYDREMRAYGGFLKFRFDTTRADTFSFDIRNFVFRDVQVWKLGRSRLTNLTTRLVRPGDEGMSYSVRFQLISNAAYDVLAFDERYVKPPMAIVQEQSMRDLRTMNGAEYLLIYHDSFANDLSFLRLDSLRRASFHGLTDTIRVSTIYDQFNYGITNPLAIRDFIQYAYENWAIRPTHVCLVGDGLPFLRGSNPGDLIPSLYPATLDFGVAAADMLFGAVSGPPWDIIPDVAVGRISCRSSNELQIYVEKVLRYEDPQQSAYNTLFHATALFVSDAADVDFNFDRKFTEPTIQLTPGEINVDRVFVDSLGNLAPSVLRDKLRDGAVIVNYNGHGGGGVWSGRNLMDVSGVTLLNNRRTYPFISNFTCYVGSFDARNQSDVLGEAFLFTRNSRGDPVGAAGVYSSSGIGWANAGIAMQSYLFDFITTPPGLTQGEIVQINKTRFWGSRGIPETSADNFYSQMMMMCLLGDPGLRLQIPQQIWSDFAADTHLVTNGDTMHVSGRLPWDPVGVADVYLLPFNGVSLDYTNALRIWDETHQESTWATTPVFLSDKVPAFDPAELLAFPVASRLLENLPLKINRLATPQGNLVIYAVDPGRAPSEGDPGVAPRDAIGVLPIFSADSVTSSARVYDVEVKPDGLILSDSTFRIQARFVHRNGVEQVHARGIFRPAQGPVLLDTVAMEQVVPGLWQTPLLGPHRVLGGNYRVQFQIKPFGGEFETSSNFYLTLETVSDFQIQNYAAGPRPGLRPGTEPYYVVPVGHSRFAGSREFPSVVLQLSATGRDTVRIPRPLLPDSLAITLDTFTTEATVLDPWQQAATFEAFLPFPARFNRYSITVKIDPLNVIPEWYETNNTLTATISNFNLFPATAARGSYLPHVDEETFAHRFYYRGAADTLWLKLLPGSLPMDSTTLIYAGPTVITTAEMVQPASAGILPPRPDSINYRYRVMLADSSELLTSGARVEVTKSIKARVPATTLSDALNRIHLFQRRSESPYWMKMDESAVTVFDVDTTYGIDTTGGVTAYDTIFVITGRVTGVGSALGQFAAFRFDDTHGPEIELAVDGMKFTPHSVLPRRPAMFITMNDYSGIDRRPGKFAVVIDNDTFPEADIAWSDSLSSTGAIGAGIHPTLDAGRHTIRVQATDNTGLSDSLLADFDVRGAFGFEWAINYPNPFPRSTTIAYVLTDASDEFVEVKIYTVSGRHIRTLFETQRAVVNYREIGWDGLDESLEEVANGVYFAKLIAQQGDQKVEKIVKMAKAR